jgi:hypothetical protein
MDFVSVEGGNDSRPVVATEEKKRTLKPLDELGVMKKCRELIATQPLFAQIRIVEWLSATVIPAPHQ